MAYCSDLHLAEFIFVCIFLSVVTAALLTLLGFAIF